MIPQREENHPNVLRKLLAAAYGLVCSGRLWYLTSNYEICNSFGLNCNAYEPSLYYSRDEK